MNIIPYVGVGDLMFGMTEKEVKAILGDCQHQKRGKLDNLIEIRGEMINIYASKTNRLCEVGFGRGYVNLSYDSINILQDDRKYVLEQLIMRDKNIFESYGFLIFMNLGITLTGFHDESEDEVAVTVFSKGVWLTDRDKLNRYVR
jgi:hypothetical protein